MSRTITPIRPSVRDSIGECREAARFHWTRENYYRLADIGILVGRRVQLIEGEIWEMAPQGIDHALTVENLTRTLGNKFANGYRVRIQLPLHGPNDSEPEPDAAIIVGDTKGLKDHPETALLVIEVSDTTLSFDRTIKARLYAEMGIADYWIINLVARQIEIHRNPQREPTGESRYNSVHAVGSGEVITPLGVSDVKIAVADLLP